MADDRVVPQVENYLDENTHVGTEKDFLERIAERNAVFGQYNLLNNNCEHLATYIRYGIQRSEQVSAKLHTSKITTVLLAVVFCVPPKMTNYSFTR